MVNENVKFLAERVDSLVVKLTPSLHSITDEFIKAIAMQGWIYIISFIFADLLFIFCTWIMYKKLVEDETDSSCLALIISGIASFALILCTIIFISDWITMIIYPKVYIINQIILNK